MNASVRHTAAALALSAALGAIPASAATTTGSVSLDVQSAVSSSGTVNVSVADGVATLTGNTDAQSKQAAERAALASPEIDRVVNLIHAS